jgi:hypothetical protein
MRTVTSPATYQRSRPIRTRSRNRKNSSTGTSRTPASHYVFPRGRPLGNDPPDKTDPKGLEAAEITTYSACVDTGGSNCGTLDDLPGGHALDTQGKQQAFLGTVGVIASLSPLGDVLEASMGTGALSAAFKEAASGGRNAGMLKNYVNRSISEIRSGVRSIEKEISEHEAKISDPAKYVKETSGRDWEKLDPREQKGLIQKWKNDISRSNSRGTC